MLKSAAIMNPEEFKYSFSFPFIGPNEFPDMLDKTDGESKLPAIISNFLFNQLDSNSYIVISILNNEHNQIGLFYKGEPFVVTDIYNRVPYTDGEELISSKLIASHFNDKQRDLLTFIKLVKKTIPAQRVIIMGGVPPVGDVNYIKKFLLERDFSDLNIIKREVHKVLFEWQEKIINEICQSEGVTYFGVPDGVLDNEGFLAEKYWQNASHANHHYGRLVLQNICNFINAN